MEGKQAKQRRVGAEGESDEERLDRQAEQEALQAREAAGGWEPGQEPQECRRCTFCGC